MDWLEQNIDAYRIISKILGELRTAIREVLEGEYGDDWHSKGLPEEVFDRLVAAKEREQSIDWYDGQYQQIMDYATFLDLIAIIEKNSDHFPEIVNLAPSVALLQARFLELDVMREKLGRARPISETELSFLGTFHVRFRKATDDARRAATGEETVPPSGDRPESSDTPKVATEDPVEDDDQVVFEPPTEPEPEKASPPRRPVQTSTDPDIRPETDPSESDETAKDQILAKEIPAASGLGGGSSDAAAVLVACNHLYRTRLDSGDLEKMGADLGSDVPFFIQGGTAMGRGTGTDLTQLQPIKPCQFLIVKPALDLKTPEVYGKLKMGLTVNSAKANIRIIKPLLVRFPQKNWPGFNRLEDVVLPSQPVLQRIVLELRESAPVAMLSGSGSAVVAVFTEGFDISEIIEEYVDAGFFVKVVGPHAAGVEITDD